MKSKNKIKNALGRYEHKKTKPEHSLKLTKFNLCHCPSIAPSGNRVKQKALRIFSKPYK